jgi:cation:H+ antiporter
MIEIALWSPFLVSGGVVVIAGLLIGRVSGELGERLKLGRVWAGTVLISLATTTPELVTTATVAFHGQAGMAIGGVLGSVVFNLLILVLMDLADPDPIYHRLSFNHLSTGLLGCVLLGVVIVAIALGLDGVRAAAPGFPRLGLASVALLGFFGLGQFVLFQMATKSANGETPIHTRNLFDRFSLKWILFAYVLLIVIIFISARGLALSVEQLAGEYRLGATFAGAVLLGVVTSLPELTNAIACARQKEIDLATGNLLGANVMVLTVLAVADFFSPSPLFASLSTTEALSSLIMAGIAIVMQGVALGALAIHSDHRVWRIGVASLILAGLYGLSLTISYRFGG